MQIEKRGKFFSKKQRYFQTASPDKSKTSKNIKKLCMWVQPTSPG